MKKRLTIFSIAIIAIASLVAGCGGSKATNTSSAPTPAPTTQSATPTTTAIPTTSVIVTTSTPPPTTSVAPTTSSAPPMSTTPVVTTSTPPASKAPYIISVGTQGANDQYAMVKVGTTVRWTGGGESGDRTVVSEISGLFGGLLTRSPPYVEYTFNTPGVFYYTFVEIANYRASITVTA